ncbi:MAG: ribosome-associated translation inhibitor RaiA [Candidatus Saccharimonadales bacterium]
MIENIQINGVHETLDDDLRKYVGKKIGHLDKYMPRKARQSAHAEVWLKQVKKDGKIQHLCEVVMRLPHDTLTTKEATMNVYAAVDIVEAKLQSQLKKYKAKHNPVRIHQRFVAHLRRS